MLLRHATNNAVSCNCPSSTGDSAAELNQYQYCASSVQTSSQTALQQATDTGSSALNTLQTTQATASPLYHMSQVDGFAPDPNSTNYDVQVQDTNTLQNAQSLTTNVQCTVIQQTTRRKQPRTLIHNPSSIGR